MKNKSLLALMALLMLLTGCQTDLPPSGDSGNSDDIIKELLVYSHRDMLAEVVNDVIYDIYMFVSYSFITRSGIAWNRIVGTSTGK